MEGFSLSAAVARFGVVELSKWHWLPGRRGEPSSHGFYKSMPYVLLAITSMSFQRADESSATDVATEFVHGYGNCLLNC